MNEIVAGGLARVSKEGKDAFKEKSLNSFYLESDYRLLKIFDSGSFSTNILGVATINHNLGYKPYALVFSQYVDWDGLSVDISDEYYQHDWYQAGATVEFYGYTKIYDNKIVITVGNTLDGGTPGTVNGFYYIFVEDI